jgi:hypothetical protein
VVLTSPRPRHPEHQTPPKPIKQSLDKIMSRPTPNSPPSAGTTTASGHIHRSRTLTPSSDDQVGVISCLSFSSKRREDTDSQRRTRLQTKSNPKRSGCETPGSGNGRPVVTISCRTFSAAAGGRANLPDGVNAVVGRIELVLCPAIANDRTLLLVK